jgi:hypothetical protein
MTEATQPTEKAHQKAHQTLEFSTLFCYNPSLPLKKRKRSA